MLGAAAEPGPRRPPRPPSEAPRSLRLAALVVGVEALALAGVAAYLLYLTLTGDPDDTGRALAEVVFALLAAVLLGVAARGLWHVASWSRGPVVAVQLLLALLGYTSAFTYDRPELGVPVLVLVAAELYLLATPESRLAFLHRP
jgi:hypothetical protein